MKERRLYMCEFCGTEYNSEEKAEECESSHSKPVKIVGSKNYYSIKSHSLYKGYPMLIDVKMSDGNIARYHLN